MSCELPAIPACGGCTKRMCALHPVCSNHRTTVLASWRSGTVVKCRPLSHPSRYLSPGECVVSCQLFQRVGVVQNACAHCIQCVRITVQLSCKLAIRTVVKCRTLK